MKLCEVITRSCHLCGEILPVYKDLVMTALACGVKDVDELIRASAMSGIGDLCYLLRYSVGSLIEEVDFFVHILCFNNIRATHLNINET